MSNIFLFTDHYNYFLYEAPTDMRRSFAGLEGIIKNTLSREMNEKDVYVFLNKSMTHIKIFSYSRCKFTLIYERLHKGTFNVQRGNNNGTLQLSANELLRIIRGIHVNSKHKEVSEEGVKK